MKSPHSFGNPFKYFKVTCNPLGSPIKYLEIFLNTF